MVADTQDWGGTPVVGTSNVAVTNQPNVSVANTPGVNVNNTPTVLGSGTFNTSNVDTNQPNVGKGVLTITASFTLAGGATQTLIAAVGGQTIRILAIGISGSGQSNVVACAVEDSSGGGVANFNASGSFFGSVAPYNNALGIGLGLRVHNTSGSAMTVPGQITVSYTQA